MNVIIFTRPAAAMRAAYEMIADLATATDAQIATAAEILAQGDAHDRDTAAWLRRTMTEAA